MLRIQYLDKDRFMRQVAASKGSVYLHLDNGETCDLKQDSAATELFQMMKAPAKGFSISVPRSGPFVCFAVLQDAAADGLCHRQQFLLPDKAKLHLVLIRIADRQL